MTGLRRYYHHHVKHHRRFHVAVLFTILAVSYVVVPSILTFIDAAAKYNPIHYEPRDPDRGDWLRRRGGADRLDVRLDDLVKVTLFVLAGLAWLAVGPPSGSSRRPPRR